MALLKKRMVVAAAALLAVGIGVAAVRMWSSLSLPSRRVVACLLPEGSESLPRGSVPFWDEVEVARYAFDSPKGIAAWTAERIDETSDVTRDSLLIRSSSPDPTLWREVCLDASRVRAIRVRCSGLTSGSFMQLYWAAAGEAFGEDRMLSLSRDDGTGSLLPTFTFPVSSHSRWQGQIGRLRIDPTSTADRRMELFSVTALDYVVREELVAAMLQESFRVDVAGDVRRAVLVPPGFPFVREVEVPRHCLLRFAFGREPGMGAKLHFRVVVEEGGTATILLDERIGPSQSRKPVPWQQRTIDLGRFAGRRVRLRFETQSAQDLDLLHGFPAFAGLELVARSPRERRLNVVLVILDTLRADRLSLYGYGRQTSPRIDEWAQTRGVVFDRVVAPAPWTLPSHASLFTGLDSLVHGAHTDEPVSERLVTLAERLRDAGYVTYAVTGGGYLASEYGLMQGFERVSYHFEPRIEPEQTGNDIESGMERTLSWLSGLAERPFFLLFHSYETHSPYRAREPYFQQFHGGRWKGELPQLTTALREPRKEEGFLIRAWLQQRVPGPVPGHRRLEPEQLPLLQDLYDSSVAFADQQVGRLLDRLVQLGLDDDTVVIITSDHGESLGERGLAGHSSLQECELLVPLIVATPSRQGAGTRIPTQVRLLDLAPTVLDLLDLEPLEGVAGRSLAPLLRGRRAAIPDEAWSYAGSSNVGLGVRLANRLKFTYNNSPWPQIRGDEALYRLGEDPGACTNVADEDPRAADLRKRAREHYETSTSGLRVSVANREKGHLEVALKGRIVTPLQVKAFDFGGAEVDWRDQSFCFTLPPGENAKLFFDGRVFGELLVSLAVPGSGLDLEGLKRIVKLDDLEEPWQASLTGGEWVDGPPSDPAPVTGVQVAIEGDWVRYRQKPAPIGQELREQLHDLGYVHQVP
jgi:arylsulfatase A-like enzyme